MRFFRIFLAALLASIVASVITFFFWLLVVVGVISAIALYDTEVDLKSNSILVVDLSEPIVDSPSPSLLCSFDVATYSVKSQLTLFNALALIEAAAADDNIEGILIAPSPTAEVSTASLEEIRAAIERFKSSGKFVVSYSDYYTQGGYYLASVADEVYMEPEGVIDWRGMASSTLFYKGLLDKLAVDVEAIRPAKCRYKSAVEPYIQSGMSNENREQMLSLINAYWDGISTQVATSRGMSDEQMTRATDNLDGFFAEDALKSSLVDGVIYRDELRPIYNRLGVEPNSKGEYHTISLGRYAKTKSRSNVSGQSCVAIIYAEGTIYQGNGGSDGIYSDALISLIRRAKSDEDVKSVVLRINSPGGDALAADAIWREVEILHQEKPVVVSMGSLAASGGYYIAAPADLILADKSTITGSIGVYGMIPSIGKALDSKLGITSEVVKSNPMADFASPLTPLSSGERRVLQRRVDNIYDKFLSVVSDGRNLSMEQVAEIAQGRVWSGEQAVDIGLVDAIGGINEALAIAASRVGLPSGFAIKEITHEPQGVEALLAFAEMRVLSWYTLREQSELKSLYKEYEQAQQVLAPITTEHGLVMYSPYKMEL